MNSDRLEFKLFVISVSFNLSHRPRKEAKIGTKYIKVQKCDSIAFYKAIFLTDNV